MFTGFSGATLKAPELDIINPSATPHVLDPSRS